MTIYQNFSNYMRCISNIEYFTLLLAIDRKSTTLNHFIGRFVLERDILVSMSRLRQFHFHIRSIL
jgi:hypothetical protein